MLWRISIRESGRLVWVIQLEAEDRLGAIREAISAMRAGKGVFVKQDKKKVRIGPFTRDIDVYPVERYPNHANPCREVYYVGGADDAQSDA